MDCVLADESFHDNLLRILDNADVSPLIDTMLRPEVKQKLFEHIQVGVCCAADEVERNVYRQGEEIFC